MTNLLGFHWINWILVIIKSMPMLVELFDYHVQWNFLLTYTRKRVGVYFIAVTTASGVLLWAPRSSGPSGAQYRPHHAFLAPSWSLNGWYLALSKICPCWSERQRQKSYNTIWVIWPSLEYKIGPGVSMRKELAMMKPCLWFAFKKIRLERIDVFGDATMPVVGLIIMCRLLRQYCR